MHAQSSIRLAFMLVSFLLTEQDATADKSTIPGYRIPDLHRTVWSPPIPVGKENVSETHRSEAI
jgi:hypothetical protein